MDKHTHPYPFLLTYIAYGFTSGSRYMDTHRVSFPLTNTANDLAHTWRNMPLHAHLQSRLYLYHQHAATRTPAVTAFSLSPTCRYTHNCIHGFVSYHQHATTRTPAVTPFSLSPSISRRPPLHVRHLHLHLCLPHSSYPFPDSHVMSAVPTCRPASSAPNTWTVTVCQLFPPLDLPRQHQTPGQSQYVSCSHL